MKESTDKPETAADGDGTPSEYGGGVSRGSFTQPSRFDELIIGTQVPCTPGASQVKGEKGRWFILEAMYGFFSLPPLIKTCGAVPTV